MHRGYRINDIKEALHNLSHSGIPFGLFILFGAPGETPATISETLNVIDQFPMIQVVSVGIGLFLWTHHQKVLNQARRDGQLTDDKALFDGAYYISPELSKTYMLDLIGSLQNKEKYRLQVNKPYAGYKKQVNAIR